MKLLLHPLAILLACSGSALAVQGTDPSTGSFDLSEVTHPTRVSFDTPGDGQLWARGATYKASFGPEGATYIPFLGSDAPKNYPVRMRLTAASLGGKELKLTESAAWTRDGEAVTLERGEVDVRYHVGLKSVEQTFVLDSLPFDGDLKVRLAVDSELELQSDGEGFRLNGDRGGVRYGSATVVDAAGRKLAVESHLDQGAIAITVPDEFLQNAALPVVVDPFITTYVISDTSAWTFSGDVAFDASYGLFMHAYTVNWSQVDSDVYSREAEMGRIQGAFRAD